MWNSISKNYDNSNYNEYEHLITDLDGFVGIKSNMNFILTDTSLRIPTPKDNSIQLWPHQEAMLYRINDIERVRYSCKTEHTEAAIGRYMDKIKAPKSYDVCLGVMNDPPGAGKTYAILTHIRMDLIPGPTIIIVPQNIYGQWRESIEKIFQNQLNKCKFSTSYVDIMDMYSNPKSVTNYKG